MQRLDVNVSPAMQPHLDIVMPATAQTATEIIVGILTVLSIIYVIIEAMKTKRYYPIMFFLGAGLAFFCEPLYDIGMTAIYPHVGQRVAIELMGRKIPFYILLCYFGLIPAFFVFAGNFIEKGVDSKTIWLAYAALTAQTIIVECIAVNFGLWSYYGAHKLWLVNYPPMIGVLNGTCFLLSTVAYVKFKPILTGNKQVLAILVMPIVWAMAEFGIGWPLFSVVNTARAVESDLLVYTGMLGTLVFAVAVISCICYAIAVPKTRTD